jgi:pimeloyl-ACP methyl ester carboxylesterase
VIDVAHGTLSLAGVSLETLRVAGDPARPTLVLLHEGLGCVALWRDFPAALAQQTGCAVFAWSRAGYGNSSARPTPWPLDYMQAEGRALPLLLTSAGIGDCVLVGHSDGASIALVSAGATDDFRIRGVVVLAPHVFAEPEGLSSIGAARVAYREGDLRGRLARYHGENVDCAFEGWSGAWLDPLFEQWNLESFLPGIRVPVLQIQGEDDQYGTARQLDAIARQVSGPVETHILPACRHSPALEQSAITLGLISDFLERWVLPANLAAR